MTNGTHPWHDISPGKNTPERVNMIVEIPKEGKIKYELDKETGFIRLDRFMYSAMQYPGDYGFIPQTLWDDGDPLDIFVLTSSPSYPMTLSEVKVIGIIRMVDEDEEDDKIVSVHATDPRFSEWNDIKDIPKHYLRELEHFLETYKELQNKKTKVYKIRDKKEAYKAIEKGIKLYQEKYANK